MKIPMYPDAEFGLSVDAIVGMPARLRAKIAESADAEEKGQFEADIPIWEAAAEQVKGQAGKYTVDFPALRAQEAILSEYGARNSKADSTRIQAAHDTLVDLGAQCANDDAEDAADQKKDRMAEAEVILERSSEPTETITFAEAGSLGELVTLAEADAQFDRANREVWITPIRPGEGNARDNFYYPSDTLREAVERGVFNNRKVYANHPTDEERKTRPERDVKDWVAVVKETVWDAPRDRPRSRVRVLDQPTFDKWEAAPEHVSFSVFGEGAARPGRINGKDKRIVEAVARVKSIDWVTEAGAGGGIDFAESAYKDEELEMSLADLTIEQLREARPDLVVALREADEPPPDKDPDEDADVVADPPADDKPADDKPAESVDTKESAAPSRAEFEEMRTQLTEMRLKEAVVAGKQKASEVIESALKATTLHRVARDAVRAKFTEASLGEGMLYPDEVAFKATVGQEIAAMQRLSDALTGGKSSVVVPPPTGETSQLSLRQMKEAALDERIGSYGSPARPKPEGETGTLADAALTESNVDLADRLSDRMGRRI